MEIPFAQRDMDSDLSEALFKLVWVAFSPQARTQEELNAVRDAGRQAIALTARWPSVWVVYSRLCKRRNMKTPQSPPRPLSLHPLNFDEAVTSILKIKPEPKQPKDKRAETKRGKTK